MGHLLRRSQLTPELLVAKYALGPYINTESGRKIIDASGGAAVGSVGASTPEVVAEIVAQYSKIQYVSPSIFTNEPAEKLANEIITDRYDRMGYSKVMFVNSGSEANESAYKIARQHFFDKNETERVNTITRDIAYHGNTVIALQLSSISTKKEPFEDIVQCQKFHQVEAPHPFHRKRKGESDIEYLERLAEELESKFQELGPSTVMAVWFESFLGTTGGCVRPPKGYFEAVRSICNKFGAIFVVDEVICGSGRCGKHFFAWEHEIEESNGNEDYLKVQPDLITFGKSISGGYAPLSGIVIHKKFFDKAETTSKVFNSGHTFQSHPVSCAAALAVQRYIKRHNLLNNVEKMGQYLGEQLKEQTRDLKCVLDVRGIGFFWAVELVKDKKTREPFPLDYNFATIAYNCILNHGVAVYPGRGTIDGLYGYSFMVSPAFTSDKDLLDKIVSAIRMGLEDALAMQEM
ncbi:uncharacterized protein PRCAT00003957001 [Priceomyces carsonii]|uniref:uncharacterized protein n=1 Tax=Priceomyces carsonii TaxID=28549 RepID=UPI002EDB0749|nr:unnamed protein product [Priceomyces carsonii]